MKKLLSLMLALALVFSLTGCISDAAPSMLPTDTAAVNTTHAEEATRSTANIETAVQPEAQPQTQPSTQPTTQPTTQPETQPETQPKPQPETQPTVQPATQPETQPETHPETHPETQPEIQPTLDKDGSYTTKEDVSLYIHLYGCLPSNFMTKSEARVLGWKSGPLEPFAPGCCIGGDTFQNREGLLPKASDRTYKECDIDTMGGGSRGAKRIVFSNDGLIYYTDDHYASFTLLYGEP